MMMFLTIVMLIVSIVSVIKGGLSTTMIKSFNKDYYVDADDKMVEKAGLTNEQRIKVATKGCLFIILMFILAVFQVIFLISSLSVDIFIIPSVLMVLWFVYGVVRAIVGKKKRTNKEKMEIKQKGAFRRLVFLLYVVYIFVLLVI